MKIYKVIDYKIFLPEDTFGEYCIEYADHVEFFKDGKLHNEKEAAVSYKNGDRYYYFNGEYFGNKLCHTNSSWQEFCKSKVYYVKFYKNQEPKDKSGEYCIVFNNGKQARFFKDGLLHKEDGAAIVNFDPSIDRKLVNNPRAVYCATLYSSEYDQYYYNGKDYNFKSDKEWKEFVNSNFK